MKTILQFGTALTLGLFISVSPLLAGDNHHGDWDNGMKGHHGEKHGHGWGHHGKGGMDTDARIKKMSKYLDLSEQQQAQLKDLFETKKQQVAPLRMQRKENRKLLRAMMDSGSFDEAELERLAKSQGDLKTQMIVIRVKHRAAMAKILTADQQQKMKDYWGKKRHHGKGHWKES